MFFDLGGLITMKRKIQKPKNKQMIHGDHRVRFYFDIFSNHPFLCISQYRNIYFGHSITDSPSRRKSGKVRSHYARFMKNPQPNKKNRAYFDKRIDTIIQKPHMDHRLNLKRNWIISNRDLRRLRRIDRNRIKSIHK